MLLLSGAILALLSGCAGSPHLSDAEDRLEAGEFDQALASVDSSLAEEPNNPEAYLTRARIFEQMALETEDPDERGELYRQVIEAQEEAMAVNGVDGAVQGERELSYIQELQAGAEEFQETQNFEKAAGHFRAARIIYPDSADAWLNEAYAMINLGDQEAAIEPMEGYVERVDTVAADEYALLGQLYLTHDRADDALPLLEEGSAEFPDDSDIQDLMLNAYTQTGEMDQAKNMFEARAEEDPEDPSNFYNLGTLLLQDGQYEEASEQLARAVELDPSDAEAQFNLGASYVNRAVDVDDEIAVLDDSLRNHQQLMSDEEVQELDAQIDGLVEERQNLFEQAVPPLERAYELSEEGTDTRQQVCNALFQAYIQTDQTEQAEEIEACATGDIPEEAEQQQ